MKQTYLRWVIIGIALLTVGIVIGALSTGTGKESAHQHNDQSETSEIWTCSMHPQIRQNEPGQCPICGMDLIPLAEGTDEEPFQLSMSETAVQLANITTARVGIGTSEKTLELTGQIVIDRTQIKNQAAHVGGRVEQYFINFEGETISRGERIAVIYSPELFTAQRELLEAAKHRDLNPALFEAAKNKLRLYKLSEAQINNILQRGQIDATIPIYADVSGVVLEERVNPGDYVQQGEVLFTVASLNNLWVVFNAYENDLAFIEEGDPVKFTVPSVPGREFTAIISFIDPVVNPNTRVVQVRAQVQNPNGQLKPDMYVRGEVTASRAQDGSRLTVPKSAVLWTGTRSIVYVKVQNTTVPTFELREVVLGPALGDTYVVDQGLTAGEEVVVNGTFTVDAAAQLRNKPSMMNREIATTGGADGGEIIVGQPDYSAETPATFKAEIQALLNEYLKIKNGLVNDNVSAAKTGAAATEKALSAVNGHILNGQAHDYWMQQADDLKKHLKMLRNSSNIDEAREHFRFVSNEMIETIRAYKPEGTLYLQFCPMANDNKGAYWLSREEEIRNPYFGEAMLTCGEVRDLFPSSGSRNMQQNPK